MNTGAFGEGFPYTNFHDMNMDWLIKIAKDFLDQYTTIQTVISEGEESLSSIVSEGLEELGEKATELTTLLDEWYTEHSSDIADQLADALQDLNDWYTLHQNYLDTTLSEKISAFDAHADAKAEETIESIPDDYTALSNDVLGIKNSLKKERVLSEEGIYTYTSLTFTAGKAISRTTGEVVNAVNNNFGATEDFIEIPIGTMQIESNIVSWSASAYGVAFYDENKDFIEAFATIYAQPVKGSYKYVRVNHNISYGTPFADIYIKMTGINKVVEEKVNSDIFERFVETGLTWTHGFIGSSGVVTENANYTLSSYIPAGLISKVQTYNGLTLNVNLYDEEKNHLHYQAYPEGVFIPDIDHSWSYARIWFEENNFDDIPDDVYIEYGMIGYQILAEQLGGAIPQIAMPSTMYMLSGIEYDLFKDNALKFPKNYMPRIEGNQPWYTSNTIVNTQRCSYIEHPENVQDSTFYTKIYSSSKEAILARKQTNIVVSNPVTNTGNLYVQIVGDSFTALNPSWIDYLLDENYCPDVHFVGLREFENHSSQYHEGRGGWGFPQYAQPATGTGLNGDNYAGFWQPAGSYKYWGDIRFWVNAKAVTPATQYVVGGFDTSKFNSSGYLDNPTTNDIMYNGTNFIKWNGTSWATVQQTDFTWGFDYSKYLSMWNITAPSICAVMLGLNEFRDSWSASNWNTFKGLMDDFIDSYKLAVPDGKFVVVVHCSNTGSNDNVEREMRTPAEDQNINMWNYRYNIIKEYDERESEDIYLCDAGVMVDGVYGYRTTTIKPFSTYDGDERITVQVGNPHPYKSFPAMSLPFAGIIQYLRTV